MFALVASTPNVVLRLTCRLFPTVVVPLPAPKPNAVAAPNALTVVAVVFSRLNVV